MADTLQGNHTPEDKKPAPKRGRRKKRRVDYASKWKTNPPESAFSSYEKDLEASKDMDLTLTEEEAAFIRTYRFLDHEGKKKVIEFLDVANKYIKKSEEDL